MAYPGQQYMVPMFPIPQVTWASAPGGNSVGKFPNPRSVLRICKLLLLLPNPSAGYPMVTQWAPGVTRCHPVSPGVS